MSDYPAAVTDCSRKVYLLPRYENHADFSTVLKTLIISDNLDKLA